MSDRFERLIRELDLELAAVGPDFPVRAAEAAHAALSRDGDAAAFLAWANQHRQWRFVVAEALGEVCAKPAELAAHVLVAIVSELREERA